jgi:GTPase SAR1 family protein
MISDNLQLGDFRRIHQTKKNRRLAYIIAIVGPDASGKTTQANLLTERLQASGYDARYVHGLYYFSNIFPRANQFREKVGPRQLRTNRQDKEGALYRVFRTLFSWLGYLFALITILFVSVWHRDQIVVFDRFYHQFFYDIYGPMGVQLSRTLPTPWRVIYLEAEFDAIRPRLSTVDKSAANSYYEAVIDHYAICATEDWLRYRAELPISTLHNQIFDDIDQDIDYYANLNIENS